MHLVCAGEVFIGGGDDGPMRIFQAVQPGFQPFHRDTAKIDDIGAHRAFVRSDQGAHHVDVFEDTFRFCDDAVPHILLYHVCFARFLR